MSMRTRSLAVSIALIIGLTMPAATAAGEGLPESCASCHSLAPQEDGDPVDKIWNREGPDLSYAGSKFNRDWLVAWLQEPTRLRPGGAFFFKATVPGEKRDAIDETKLIEHPRLNAAEAEATSDALMALKAPSDKVVVGAYGGEPGNARIAKMAFTKLRGCSACHQNAPGKGGLSGPELYTAGDRLQADFIASYIRNPQSIDAGVWMPVLEMSEKDVQQLTGYLLSLGTKDGEK